MTTTIAATTESSTSRPRRDTELKRDCAYEVSV